MGQKFLTRTQALQSSKLWRAGARIFLLKSLYQGTVRRKTTYLKSRISPKDFFLALNSLDVNYSVLRWGREEKFPSGHGDIDLLITDENFKQLKQFISFFPRKSSVVVDLKSVGGQTIRGREGHPYLPPHLARQVLENSAVAPNGIRVPSAEHEFLLLAYHCVFHKGRLSGVATNNREVVVQESKYVKRLSELAETLDIQVNLTLVDLLEFLKQEAWMPSFDNLVKLSRQNEFLEEQVTSSDLGSTSQLELPDLTTVLVRENAVEARLLEMIRKTFIELDLEIIWEHLLAPSEVELMTKMTRGATGQNATEVDRHTSS